MHDFKIPKKKQNRDFLTPDMKSELLWKNLKL